MSLATVKPSAYVRSDLKPTHNSGEHSSQDDYFFLPPCSSSNPLFLSQQNPKNRRLCSATGSSDEIVSLCVISVVWFMPTTIFTI